jgi:ectoine hydroxylase-related dioxygenase (phytanoyl-CoA dioxygenase family)
MAGQLERKIDVPQATRDRSLAKRDLDEYGFCVVLEALDAAQLAAAKRRLEEQADAEIELGIATRDGGGPNQRMWNLINKGRRFRDMITHPLVDELVGHVLGEQFILSTLSANIARPGGVRMGLHTDQWWMPPPMRRGADHARAADITRSPTDAFVNHDQALGISPPVVANTMWMLSEFSAENGATEVVPRSHVSGTHPDPENQERYDIVQAQAPAGSLMVFDGRLWHGTGANTGTSDRLGVLGTFCCPQFRQQENQTLALDPALWDTLSQKMKARLGFKVWYSYGRVESPAATVRPDPERTGELRPGLGTTNED